MPYYLQHYFDPDFDYLNRKPTSAAVHGQISSLHTLGFVQNVIDGQIIAEIIPLESAGPNPDPRFIMDTPHFPAGDNVKVDPSYPQYLLAATNGYVFYYQGKMTVKNLLNVRQDVSFKTGSIFYVGDLAVHGSVKAGFEVQANNLRIMGMLEGGVARSRANMKVDGGAKGGTGQNCLLDAGGKLVVSYLEKIEARTTNTIVVEKYCLYSTIYAGTNMVVRDQLYGGEVTAYGSVVVGRQLGNDAGIETKIFLGYNPRKMQRLEKIDKTIAELSETIIHLRAAVRHLHSEDNETTRKLERVLRQRKQLTDFRNELWTKFNHNESYMQNCRLMVKGKVFPGVEISIGQAFARVTQPYENVVFRLNKHESIIMEHLPERF